MEDINCKRCTYCIDMYNQFTKVYDKSCIIYEREVSNGRNIHTYSNYKHNAQSSLKMLYDFMQKSELSCTHVGFEHCEFPNVVKYVQASKRNVYALLNFVGNNV